MTGMNGPIVYAPFADESTLLATYEATVQHVEMLQRKIQRLEQARADAEEQMCGAIARDHRAGAITDDDLVDIYGALRSRLPLSFGARWDRNVSWSSRKVASKWKFRPMARPNGPGGRCWQGNYPLPPEAPAPTDGVSVVYVLFDERNEPIYVGSSHKFRRRLTAHDDDGKVFASWVAYPCADRQAAYDMEAELLLKYGLRLNRRRVP